MPAAPIATSVCPTRQAAAQGVGDDDGDVHAEQPAQVGAQAGGAGVGVGGEQGERVAAATLEPSTPAAACTMPSLSATISVRPRRATTRTVSASTSSRRSRVALLRVGRGGHEPALDLGERPWT